MPKIEFFYDLSSPWTYLAFHNIQAMLKDIQADITWRPFLVGGVFNAVNDSVYQTRNSDPQSAKQKPQGKWLTEWGEHAGVALNFPSSHHPLKSVLAMRMCCCIEQDQSALFKFSNAAFNAYFVHKKNLDDPNVLVDIANNCGLNGSELLEQIQQPSIKAALRDNTDEAIGRGAFGSPTIFINEKHMYFGNDQLPLVKQCLKKLT